MTVDTTAIGLAFGTHASALVLGSRNTSRAISAVVDTDC